MYAMMVRLWCFLSCGCEMQREASVLPQQNIKHFINLIFFHFSICHQRTQMYTGQVYSGAANMHACSSSYTMASYGARLSIREMTSDGRRSPS